MPLRQIILKRLILQYQEEHSPAVFEKILKRIDGLIIYIVYCLIEETFYLRDIEPQELYQAGIVGLYDALDNMSVKIAAEKIPSYIVSRVQSSIRRVFRYKGRPEEATCQIKEDDLIYEDTLNMEFLELIDVLTHMYMCDRISLEEISLLSDKFALDKTVRCIGKERHISHEWARVKVLRAIGKVKRYFSGEDNEKDR